MLSRPASTMAKRSIAEAEPSGRRHPVGEGLDVVRVARLPPAACAANRSACSSGSLISREGVPQLHPADEVLEPLDDLRIVVGRPRERRELDRVVVEDRRLDQLGLDEVGERVVDELGPVLVGGGVDAPLVQPLAQLGLVARPELALLERVDELERASRARPGRLRGRGR